MALPSDEFLIFGSPAIGEEEVAEVVASMRSGWLGTGPKVSRFEADFAAYKDVPSQHAAALNSCTAALHLSVVAAGIGAGDEVITTAMTFAASVNAIIHAGATPVLADIDPRTFNVNPAAVEERISSRTKAILPVHFAGRACDMDALLDLAQRYDLKIIEDCAHAIETEYRGTKAGRFGDFGCFSFYVTKNVVTGEGGMVLAKSEDDAARVRRLALHGLSNDAWKRFSDSGYRHYSVEECGYKYNMMDLQAAIGIHQLKRVEENWQRREDIWRKYDQGLDGLPLRTPPHPEPDTRHAYHLYTILLEDAAPVGRDAFLTAMTSHKIGVGVHYLSIPEHPYYKQRFGWAREEYPAAFRVGRQTVSLPLSAKLTDDDISRVIQAVRSILS